MKITYREENGCFTPTVSCRKRVFTRYGKTIGCDQDFLSDIEEGHIHCFGECTPYRDQKANPRADSSIVQKGLHYCATQSKCSGCRE